MNTIGYAANLLGWPLLQMAIGFATTRLPSRLFADDCWLTVGRSWERNGSLYAGRLALRRWKRLLPDGATWFGGFPKKKIASHHPAYLRKFVLETRRSEIAHWCMLCCFPIFFLWNPQWACFVMVVYGLAANLPCIIVQRYNRMVLLKRLAIPSREAVSK
jgi:glycosyl-4,4'-diaponeurosporenoate acyltransferase